MGLPELTIIVAMDRQGLIGREGALPWRIPADLRDFRRLTMGHVVIMGRRTYQSLPGPLDGRELLVMSRDHGFTAGSNAVAHSVHEVQRLLGGRAAYVAGGAEVYAAFLPLARHLRVTMVEGEHRGDTSFPPVDWDAWRLAWVEPCDPASDPRYSIRLYHRAEGGPP